MKYVSRCVKKYTSLTNDNWQVIYRIIVIPRALPVGHDLLNTSLCHTPANCQHFRRPAATFHCVSELFGCFYGQRLDFHFDAVGLLRNMLRIIARFAKLASLHQIANSSFGWYPLDI